MQQTIQTVVLIVIFVPLLGAAIAGIGGKLIGRSGAHWVTILGIAIAFCGALYLFGKMIVQGMPAYNTSLYTWAISGSIQLNVGFLIDRLTVVMMLTVTFVSLLVHIYSIGYMEGDSGYQRFFSYMSLFTFFMLMLVTANNFMLLFFGWEGVGLVSYLLIGFWFQKESAALGSLKAFIVNRVGDFGFILGIGAILAYFGSLDYAVVFNKASSLANATMTVFPHTHWSVITLICVLLFIGAMGKSAQIPLHVWLPESMEGPTPISALIHAATMVTAGVYMVARLSPLYEYSQTALSLVLIVGASGALFLGLIALVQNDIKRVIAYSTMSQLGYMMAANGVSAFSAGIFHLMTHACFKALLFLAAGSVIIALHHEQDMRKMGDLRKHMPITYLTFLIGALALAAIPPFAGFYSKDAIIEAVQSANIPGATYAYYCLLLGAFVTALYIFRAFFMTFHSGDRTDAKLRSHIHESRSVVIIPLIVLAIPSMLLGVLMAKPMLYNTQLSLLGGSIFVLPQYDFFVQAAAEFQGVFYAAAGAFLHLPFWFALLGVVCAWIAYVRFPGLPGVLRRKCHWLYWILMNKYGFDAFYRRVFVKGGLVLSHFFYNTGDMKLIDGVAVNGTGHEVSRISSWVRRLQSGYLYHYAFAMILGLFVFLVWLLV
ncbi:MAG TPA: NADH-quinone oxidoreductase subunit L [Gammaproteobacteria bacterium]|nr:NADH-quinone oxidoreductase subunit L [Gammaproteobacteria bacterium]